MLMLIEDTKDLLPSCCRVSPLSITTCLLMDSGMLAWLLIQQGGQLQADALTEQDNAVDSAPERAP